MDCDYKENSLNPCDSCPRKISALYVCKVLQETTLNIHSGNSQEKSEPAKEVERVNGDICTVNLPVKVIFEWSDKIITDVDDNGAPIEYESGYLMKVLSGQNFVYTDQPHVFVAHTFKENNKQLTMKGIDSVSESKLNKQESNNDTSLLLPAVVFDLVINSDEYKKYCEVYEVTEPTKEKEVAMFLFWKSFGCSF